MALSASAGGLAALTEGIAVGWDGAVPDRKGTWTGAAAAFVGSAQHKLLTDHIRTIKLLKPAAGHNQEALLYRLGMKKKKESSLH